jgi:hypothetical protein
MAKKATWFTEGSACEFFEQITVAYKISAFCSLFLSTAFETFKFKPFTITFPLNSYRNASI